MAEEERGAAGVAALAEANAPVFETLVRMTLDTFGRSGPDQETCLLARIAALVTVDASAHGKDDRPGLTSGSGRLAHPGPKAPLPNALRPRTQTTPNRRSNGQLCESRL